MLVCQMFIFVSFILVLVYYLKTSIAEQQPWYRLIISKENQFIADIIITKINPITYGGSE